MRREASEMKSLFVFFFCLLFVSGVRIVEIYVFFTIVVKAKEGNFQAKNLWFYNIFFRFELQLN